MFAIRSAKISTTKTTANAFSNIPLMSGPARTKENLSGFIISLNRRLALMGINTGQGISIVEVLDSHEPALGDSVAGSLHSLGCGNLHNVSQGIRFEALIQEVHDDLIRMRNMLDDTPPEVLPG